ncbi:acyltransferase [Photobacterium nomapromontoriensis]|uniref:acyltransferase n=1 Tax=Photobacterium nomapromontoriensis TaxID=2910237 RepID=UPI003D119AFD
MNTQRIASFEWGRVAALFAVIIIHSQAFMTGPFYNDQPWLGLILNQLSRFAVPLFFILAGYFIMPKLKIAPSVTFRCYSLPLLKIWLIWSVIYLLLPFNAEIVFTQGYLAERVGYWQYLLQHPLNSLFEGGLVHLWYIPALLCGLAILAVCCHYKQEKWLLLVGSVLYIYGLMAGSYAPIYDLPAPIFTRNGPFLSTLMLSIGFIIHQNKLRVSSPIAASIAVIGMMLHLGEAFFLTRYDLPFNGHDFLMGTLLWATGIFLLLANKPDFGRSTFTFAISQNTLGIYLCHMMILILLLNLFPYTGFPAYVTDILRIVLTFLLSLGLIRLLSIIPSGRLLLR